MMKVRLAPGDAVRRAVFRLMVLLAALLFAGCALQPDTPDQSAPYMQGLSRESAAFYLQKMQQSSHESKVNWQLLAIRALLDERQLTQAQDLFQQLPESLSAAQQVEKTLLAAQIKLAQKDYAGAVIMLTALKPDALTTFQQQRYWQIQIDARQGVPSLALLRALISQQPLLQGAAAQQNIDATWRILTQMTPQQANSLVINASEHTLQGWLDLQHAWFANRHDPALWQDSIKNWQTRYPQNPAAKMLPTALLSGQYVAASSAEKVALLLPLNGQAAVFGNTIEQGFLMAKNTGTSPVTMPAILPAILPEASPDAPAATATSAATASSATPEANSDAQSASDDLLSVVPDEVKAGYASDASAEDNGQNGNSRVTVSAGAAGADSTAATAEADAAPAGVSASRPDAALLAGSVAANPAAQLKVYDTTAQPMSSLMAQVQQDGATIVVGPLLKQDVAALQGIQTPLNVLALNQPETVSSQPNLCYFALSPEDEARDAAWHIWQQGQQHPLVLVPRGQFGARISRAFASAWRQAGGGEVLQQVFDSVSDLKQQINHNVGIRLTGTPVLPLSGEQAQDAADDALAADNTASPVTHAAAVDAVYIIATQPELALIKPMIAMNTSSHSKVAYYASSRSVRGGEEVDYRMEMDGLQFSDIPMLTGGNPALMQKALAAVHGDYSLARLYAMGVDAWTLVNNFNRLRQQPGFTADGNSGQITADQDCVIHRKLTWLKYQNGKIVPVPAAN